MKVSFGTSKVQKNRRIALDPNLLTNMGLAEGDDVLLYLDTDSKAIVIERLEIAKNSNKSFGAGKNAK